MTVCIFGRNAARYLINAASFSPKNTACSVCKQKHCAKLYQAECCARRALCCGAAVLPKHGQLLYAFAGGRGKRLSTSDGPVGA